MGVDGPRGRAEGGGRRLTAPFLTERVDLPSRRQQAEVMERIEAVTRRGRARGVFESQGVEHRGDAARLVLAVRHPYADPVRPVAIVSVRRDEAGTTWVRGVIRSSRFGQAWLAGYFLIALAAVLAGPVSVVAGGEWGVLLIGPAMVAGGFIVSRLSFGDRATLRRLLEDVTG